LIDRIENVATPLDAFAVSVPDNVPEPGLVPIATVTGALEVVTTLPYVSSTETATLGIELPAVPGPGVAGVKASFAAAAGLTFTVGLLARFVAVPPEPAWEPAVNETVPAAVGAVM